jgi:hypothetical protein
VDAPVPTGFLAAWEQLLGAAGVPTLPRRRGRPPRVLAHPQFSDQ